MAELASTRKGQLVVRYHAPWRRRLLLAAVVLGGALTLYGVFEWGRYQGGFDKLAELQRTRELTARVATLEQDNERLRAELAAVELARSVDRKAYADVEASLAELQSQVLRHREELTFYRGIVSPEDGVGGLRIQRLQILDAGVADHYQLRLVLVQSMRQDTVASGTVSVEIEGIRDGQLARLTLAEAVAPAADAQREALRADRLVPFRFRYFQNLEHNVVLPAGFEPRSIDVEVRSGRMTPVRESFPWQVEARS